MASDYIIVSMEEDETEVEVELEETIYYLREGKFSRELVYHTISLIYNDKNMPVVVADSYYEEYSEFISASYVNPHIMFLTDEAGSDECIVGVAATQVGYLEKETNSNLDSFTANAGNGNYTKYGKWYGQNGVPWCAIFVSWCANQANISTSIINKTASCDSGMNFFKGENLFYASKAYGGNYTPKVGDIFYYGTSTSNATHTGIVEGVNDTYITVVHGNSQNQVRRSTYSLTNTKLLGFGSPAYENDTHSYEYSISDQYHTGICSACNHSTGLVKHTINYSYHANSHWGRCTECGYYATPTNHTYTMVYNEEGHWSKCSECAYNYGTTVEEHSYVWKYNDTEHWKQCSECGYKTTNVVHQWQNMGTYTKCVYCGKTQ